MSLAFYPLIISGSRSFQEETISPLTSPASPLTTSCLTLCLFFQDSNQLFDALNESSVYPRWFAICFAFSFKKDHRDKCSLKQLCDTIDTTDHSFHQTLNS